MHKAITTPTSPRIPSESEVYLFVSKITSKATRNNLIKVLQDVQNGYGYLPEVGLKAISQALKVPLSKVYGVATFYHQFKLEPPGRYVILVCKGTACHAKGMFSLEPARCFGCCSLAPVIMIMSNDGSYKKLYGHITPALLRRIIDEYSTKVLKEVTIS